MTLFRNIVFAAALAGLIAGLFVTIVHSVGTVPIILKAETYEKAADGSAAAATSADAATAQHRPDAEAWEPTNGFERTAFTALFNVLTGIAFGLLLTAAYALRARATDWRQGLFWGLAGFATFTLAPGLGLPPEIPGTESAPLLDRQVWWVATAIATAGGLTSGIDMALHVVSRYFGADVAAATAAYMEYSSDAWREGTVTFSTATERK